MGRAALATTRCLQCPAWPSLCQSGLSAVRAGLTYAELRADEKNRLSHRTRALRALLPDLRCALIGWLIDRCCAGLACELVEIHGA